MKFYDKYYTSNYEELITYYPRFYRDVFEMVEILKAHGRIADGMEDNIEQAYLNGFIDYADEATIAKLERFLEIGLNRNRTLEERRRLVKSYFVGFGNLTMGTAAGLKYVAQVEIPARQYDEEEQENPAYDPEAEDTGEGMGMGATQRTIIVRTPVPFDIDNCTIYLWGMEE